MTRPGTGDGRGARAAVELTGDRRSSVVSVSTVVPVASSVTVLAMSVSSSTLRPSPRTMSTTECISTLTVMPPADSDRLHAALVPVIGRFGTATPTLPTPPTIRLETPSKARWDRKAASASPSPRPRGRTRAGSSAAGGRPSPPGRARARIWSASVPSDVRDAHVGETALALESMPASGAGCRSWRWRRRAWPRRRRRRCRPWRGRGSTAADGALAGGTGSAYGERAAGGRQDADQCRRAAR
jgi:hypothetical protein